ncbi:MAG: hypothetical protein KF709_01190 [Gemmatimonadaceae bacterium]|nr:hypothetical protein [Gemmatimonadaceae bacterium]
MRGDTDLDLLIAPGDWPKLEAAALAAGFVEARTRDGLAQRAARYFVGLRADDAALVHFDVVDAVVTGGHLWKSHRLPFDDALRDHGSSINGIPIAARHVELAVLVVRRALETLSLLEFLLAIRSREDTVREVNELADSPETLEQAIDLALQLAPTGNRGSFVEFVDCLRTGSALRLLLAGRRLGKHFEAFRVVRQPRLGALRSMELGRKLWARARGTGQGWSTQAPTPIIAFVGPKAVGKSTLIRASRRLLGRFYRVETVHLGRPRATALTWFRHPLRFIMSALLPRGRKRALTALPKEQLLRDGFLTRLAFATQALLLAVEKRAAVRRCRRLASGGIVVITDRYPVGAIDGKRLDVWALDKGSSSWMRLAARLEERLFASIAPPDVVVRLTIDEEEAVRRNAARLQDKGRIDAEGTIRARHAEALPDFPAPTLVVDVDTSGSIDETVKASHRAVWSAVVTRERWHRWRGSMPENATEYGESAGSA